MPMLAPKLSPEPVLPPAEVLPLSPPPVATAEEIVEGAMMTDDAIVLPLDVKAEMEVLPETVEIAFVEVGPDVAELELGAPEELPAAPVLVESELPDGATDPDAGTEEGTWSSRN